MPLWIKIHSSPVEKWKRFWISELIADPSVEAKLRWRRGLSLEELKRDFVGNRKLQGLKESHPIHGDRWLVSMIDEPLPKVVLILIPIIEEFDIWKVVTAFTTRNSKQVGR